MGDWKHQTTRVQSLHGTAMHAAAAVRADAGVLGQAGRLPKEAKNVLLSTSFHSPQTDGRHYAASGMPCIVQLQSFEKRAWCELAHQHA